MLLQPGVRRPPLRVTAISGRTGWNVDYVEFQMSDGTTRSHGNAAMGYIAQSSIRLDVGELLVAVGQISIGQDLGQRLAFTTSRGQQWSLEGTMHRRKKKHHEFHAPACEHIVDLLFDATTLVGIHSSDAVCTSCYALQDCKVCDICDDRCCSTCMLVWSGVREDEAEPSMSRPAGWMSTCRHCFGAGHEQACGIGDGQTMLQAGSQLWV
jgi:hypothetical protein